MDRLFFICSLFFNVPLVLWCLYKLGTGLVESFRGATTSSKLLSTAKMIAAIAVIYICLAIIYNFSIIP